MKLVIGGGSGTAAATCGSAIVLVDNWLRGSSNPCETFASSHSLCCSSDFIVGDVEFWGLVPEDSRQPSVPVVRPFE
jgi:hypothetical protein